MRLRRRLLRNILIWAVFLTIVSTWYINTFLAEGRLKALFIKNLSETLNRPVSIDSIRFSIVRGFIIKDLTIYEPDQKTLFIHIKQLSTTNLFIPLLYEKKILIPAIYIDKPFINVTKNQEKTWNFSTPELLKKELFGKKASNSGFSILVQKIRIDDATINFTDNSKTPAYGARLVNLEGEVAFFTKDTVNFKLIAQLDSALKSQIAVDGGYSQADNLVTMKVSTKNLPLIEPYRYFHERVSLIDVKNGLADIELGLKIYSTKALSVDAKAAITGLDLSLAHFNLKGDVGIEGASIFELKDTFEGDFKVLLNLKGPALSGIYLLNELKNLNGKIKITNKGIFCDYLWGDAYNTSIRFSGGIDDFTKLILKADMQAEMDLSNYSNFLTDEMKSSLSGLALEGPAEVSIDITDNLKDPQPPTLHGNIKLKDAKLKTPLLNNKVEKIFGNISFKDDVYYFSKFSLGYNVKDYILDAKITNTVSPEVLLKLKNDDLSLDTRFQLRKRDLHIIKANGKYINSDFNLGGDIRNFDEPIVALSGKIALDLVDLRKCFPKAEEQLTRHNIKGKGNLEFTMTGPVKDLRDLQAQVRGKFDRINIWDMKLDNVALDLRMDKKTIYIADLSAAPYDGRFTATMDIDLSQQNPPYNIKVALEEVNLSRLASDTDMKDKPISGTGLLKCNIHGYGSNLETMKGEGLLIIKGGYLWEIPLLKGLADILFLPNLSSIVFDEVSADFSIANKNISTANLTLHSPNISLLGEGIIDFDGKLDFVVTTSISQEFIKGSSAFSQLTGTLLAEAGQLIGKIKVTGTAKKPEYKFTPFPLDKILSDKLKAILGGIF